MDEYTAEAFANRDEPIPVIAFPGSEGGSSSDTPPAASKSASKLRTSLSPSRLKEKLPDVAFSSASNGEAGNAPASPSLQDRLFAK